MLDCVESQWMKRLFTRQLTYANAIPHPGTFHRITKRWWSPCHIFINTHG